MRPVMPAGSSGAVVVDDPHRGTAYGAADGAWRGRELVGRRDRGVRDLRGAIEVVDHGAERRRAPRIARSAPSWEPAAEDHRQLRVLRARRAELQHPLEHHGHRHHRVALVLGEVVQGRLRVEAATEDDRVAERDREEHRREAE